jgi:hypothetical protein
MEEVTDAEINNIIVSSATIFLMFIMSKIFSFLFKKRMVLRKKISQIANNFDTFVFWYQIHLKEQFYFNHPILGPIFQIFIIFSRFANNIKY